MDRRITIRRLDVTPSKHSFCIKVRVQVNETYDATTKDENNLEHTQ